MQFIKLAKVGDFAEIRIKSFQVLGKFIAIVREQDGSFYATEIACKHNNADLTTGRFEGDVVTCSRHGWKYNIRTAETEHRVVLRWTLAMDGHAVVG